MCLFIFCSSKVKYTFKVLPTVYAGAIPKKVCQVVIIPFCIGIASEKANENDQGIAIIIHARLRCAVGYVPDCRSRGCKFDPGLVPYFRGD